MKGIRETSVECGSIEGAVLMDFFLSFSFKVEDGIIVVLRRREHGSTQPCMVQIGKPWSVSLDGK